MTERTKGLLITFVGVMAIIPDALLVRLVVADEWTTLFWRGVLTAISITVALVITHRRQTFLRFAQIGALGVWLAALFAGGAICFVVAITLTKVANVLFIVATTPLYAAIIARVFLGERVPLRIWIAIGFAMVGVAVIASASATRGADSVLGDALAFLEALSMAVTLSLARKARSHSMVPANGAGWCPVRIGDTALRLSTGCQRCRCLLACVDGFGFRAFGLQHVNDCAALLADPGGESIVAVGSGSRTTPGLVGCRRVAGFARTYRRRYRRRNSVGPERGGVANQRGASISVS